MTTEPGSDAETILSENIPVTMPELPATLTVNTAQQFKALGDSTRSRILSIIKHEPATAKQIGDRLKIPPGTAGHHLAVLEAAGLAQVVARRLVHGIVARYYARTARLFLLDFPSEIAPEKEEMLSFLTEARDQLADTVVAEENKTFCKTGFPHTRLSLERAEEFAKRLSDLAYEFATEPPDPNGQVYGLCTAFFLSPSYLQHDSSPSSTDTPLTEEE